MNLKNRLILSSLIIFLSCSFIYAEEYVNGVRHDEVEVIQWDAVLEPSASPINTARAYYNATQDKLMLSVNGGAYFPINETPASMYVATPPTTPIDTCTKGQYSVASGWHYDCVATNTWQRVALTTWALQHYNIIFETEQVQFDGADVIY